MGEIGWLWRPENRDLKFRALSEVMVSHNTNFNKYLADIDIRYPKLVVPFDNELTCANEPNEPQDELACVLMGGEILSIKDIKKKTKKIIKQHVLTKNKKKI